MLFDPDYTGAGIRFQTYAPFLKRNGINLVVFTGTTLKLQPTHFVDMPRLRRRDDETVSIYRVRLPENIIIKNMLFASKLVNFYRHQMCDIDLIHLLTVTPFGLPWLERLKRTGVPIVQSHTMTAPLSRNLVKASLQRKYQQIRFSISDAIITNTKTAELNLVQDYAINTPIHVIANGVNLERFYPANPIERRKLRQELGLPADSKIVLFVGALIKRKGIDVLLDAWEIIVSQEKKALLVLVGPFPASTSELGQAFTQLERMQSNRQLMRIGCVSNVEDYFRAADIFVFPSRREGFPNSLLEAFACGLPTIITPFLGLGNELDSERPHYIICDRTAESLSHSVLSLLHSPDQQKILGKAARNWVEQNMSLNETIEKYTQCYRSLVRATWLSE